MDFLSIINSRGKQIKQYIKYGKLVIMENVIKVPYKNVVLSLIKDCYIYEVFYNNVYLGYFHFSRLAEAIEEIANNGFYDGYNYDYRLKNLNVI